MEMHDNYLCPQGRQIHCMAYFWHACHFLHNYFKYLYTLALFSEYLLVFFCNKMCVNFLFHNSWGGKNSSPFFTRFGIFISENFLIDHKKSSIFEKTQTTFFSLFVFEDRWCKERRKKQKSTFFKFYWVVQKMANTLFESVVILIYIYAATVWPADSKRDEHIVQIWVTL